MRRQGQLAIWRGVVANRRANTAQQDLLTERYQKGAEILGSEVLSVRWSGMPQSRPALLLR